MSIPIAQLDELRARILTGGPGDAEGLAVLLELRDWLRLKDYAKVRKVLGAETQVLGTYFQPGEVEAALQAFASDDPGRIEPYTGHPFLGAEAHAVIGLQRVREANAAAARQAFEAALALDPGHFRAITNLGNLEFEFGPPDAAIAHYQQALKLHSEYAPAHQGLAAAYRKQGQIGLSVQHLKKANRSVLKAPARPVKEGAAPPPTPPVLGSGMWGRWWVWVVLAVVVYVLLR
jgi:tetratricopeptide (TPR) repeat protein